MPDTTVAQDKLIQYLNEAYGLERRLETALRSHVGMTTHAAYKKRLKEHLAETKRHAREVRKRIKQLGGVAATVDAPGPSQIGEAAQAVLGGAQKAVALAQGPLHALRGTGQEEKHLKNAKTEYAGEAEEIATYSSIEALAEELGDGETKKLARAIRREEERMRSYLEKEIPRFAKAVARAEVPTSQRGTASRAKAPAKRGRRASAGVRASGRVKASAATSKASTRKQGSVTRRASKATPRPSRARAGTTTKAKGGSTR